MPADDGHEDFTAALAAVRAGTPDAEGRLLTLVYEDLRALAISRLRALGPGQTLQPTELVHEAFMRLAKGEDNNWESRRHFIAVAALAMRSVIVDRARARNARKRGNGQRHAEIGDTPAPQDDPAASVLEIDEALKRLESVDPRSARVVLLRFYLGLSELEIAEALGVTDRTVRRDWTFARAWLHRELGRAWQGIDRPGGAGAGLHGDPP